MSESPANGLVQAAKNFVPDIIASRDRIDTERQLPHDLAENMAGKQLFGLYVPKELNGPETDPITAYHVCEEGRPSRRVGRLVRLQRNGGLVGGRPHLAESGEGNLRRSPRRSRLRLSPRRGHREDYRRRLHRLRPLELPQRHRPLHGNLRCLPRHRRQRPRAVFRRRTAVPHRRVARRQGAKCWTPGPPSA